MISKGTTHNNGARLAAYMTTDKEGERAELWQLRGFQATNIKDAFRDVQIMSEGTKARQPFFHVQVRNREGETLTRQQWEHAADRIEAILGLTDQPRAIAFHVDEHTGEEHMHVAWSRIDQETMKAKALPFFKERLKKISRELEAHFALEPVTNQREGNIRFAPTRAEHEQARRLGLDIHEVRNTIRNCWDRSDCGASFQAALEDQGLTLAKGERRDFVVIDQAGGIHALGKRILDVTAAQARTRMADLSRDDLPTVEMARALLPEREPERTQREEKLGSIWDRDRADRAWQDGVINAAIEREKVERQFVEPGQRETRAGGRKECPVMPPKPEPITTFLRHHFEDAARERVQPMTEGLGERRYQNAGRNGTVLSGKSAKAGRAAVQGIGRALDVIGGAVESLFAPQLTPEQIREGEKTERLRKAEAESAIDFSRYAADLAQQRQKQEQDIEAARQRERDRGGRER
jgi:hypothetical protein